jgi:hypothetical protein
LQKLKFKKRIKILLNFFKNWIKVVKKYKARINEPLVDNKFWYSFAYKSRPKTFRWRKFKVYLRKKEKINWNKFYKFLKYGVLNSNLDFKSIRKKIRNQQYSQKYTDVLINKFMSIRGYRFKLLEEQKK